MSISENIFPIICANSVDAVKHIIEQAYKQCRDLLDSKRKEIELIAEELLTKEVLVRDDMVRLLGKRPFEDRDEFNKYFNNEKPAPKAEKDSSAPPSGDAPKAPDASAPFPRHSSAVVVGISSKPSFS